MIAFWNYFVYFAIVAVLLWITGAWAAWKDRQGLAYSATLAGLAVFFVHPYDVDFARPSAYAHHG